MLGGHGRFSCRSQIEQLDSGDRQAMHLAELLDAARRGVGEAGPLEHAGAPRPAPPSGRAQLLAAVRTAASALAAAGAAVGAVAVSRARKR